MTEAASRYRILLTTWQDFAAGSIQSVQYLAQGLLGRGHDLRVACPADGVLGRRLRAAGVPVVDFHFRPGWSLRSARALADLIARDRIQIVDAQESRDRKAAILARYLFRSPARLVVTRRQQSSSFPPENWLYSVAADRVIAISEGVRRDLVRKGMRERAIRVVHTGLDPARVEGEVAAEELDRLRRELGLDPALPTLGVVARRKDQETLLRALARLDRPVNALFIGIERDAALAGLESALPDGGHVAYTGFRDPVLPFYHLLDVKVLTTRAEGLSQAILESMMLGVPVISAAVGGTPEVVDEGRTGLLYPPGDDAALADRIRTLLDDPGLGRSIAAAARERVGREFHAERFARETEAVYHELVEAS